MPAMTSFYDWLAKQKQLRTPIGEFARDAARDKGFPRDVETLDALLEYLRTTPKSSAQTLAVARLAYQGYVRAHRPPPNL